MNYEYTLYLSDDGIYYFRIIDKDRNVLLDSRDVGITYKPDEDGPVRKECKC